ncbi:MAG: hypothetical protein WBQ73_02455 [Candidatus Babeliales bacterium]
MHSKHPYLFYLVIMLATISFIATTWILLYRKNYVQTYQSIQKQTLQEKTSDTAHHVGTLLTELRTLTETMQNYAYAHDEHQSLKKALQQKPSHISGLGFAFTQESTASYYVESEGKQELVSLTSDAYAHKQWFTHGLHYQGFSSVHDDPATGQGSIFYTLPLVDEHKQPLGLIFATQSLQHIRHMISAQRLGDAGYWFLLEEDGSLLVHPDSSLMDYTITFKDIAKKGGNNDLVTNFQVALQGTPQKNTYYNEITGELSWIFLERIPETNWILCGSCVKKELLPPNDYIRQSLILIIAGYLITLILLVIASFFYYGITATHVLWFYSSLLSCILLAGISLIWSTSSHYPTYEEPAQRVNNIVDLHMTLDLLESKLYAQTTPQTQRDTTLNPKNARANREKSATPYGLLLRNLGYSYENPLFVPTGIFLNQVEFVTENSVSITGYIWQRYYHPLHDSVTRGFILPEAIGTPRIDKIYQAKHNNLETIVWQINATLYQSLVFTRYPFDTKNITVKLWHADLEKIAILIPDLDSYLLTIPNKQFGLYPELSIPGWSINQSYFSYQTRLRNTLFGLYQKGPFGMYQHTKTPSSPTLCFMIAAKRQLVDTLITDLLPIAVIFVLLFVIFLVNSLQGYGALGSYASIFFSSTLAQARFRSKIPTNALVYFESLYFIIYITLLLTVTITLIHLLNIKIPYIRDNDLFLPKLLFWPFVLSAIFITAAYALF